MENQLEQIKKQFNYDVCSKTVRYPKPICENRPPEITNLMNACLSCPLRKTCKLLFSR